MRSYLAGEVNDELANQRGVRVLVVLGVNVIAYDQASNTLSLTFKFAGGIEQSGSGIQVMPVSYGIPFSEL